MIRRGKGAHSHEHQFPESMKYQLLIASLLFPLALNAQTDSSARQAPVDLLAGPIHTTVKTLAGDSVRLGIGAPMTLVAVFATWCRPCQDEVPILNMLHRDFASKVRVIGLDLDEGGDAHVEQWLKKYGAKYPVARDNYKVVSKSLHASGVPALFLVNGSGHFEWSRNGAMLSSLPELRKRLNQLPDLAK